MDFFTPAFLLLDIDLKKSRIVYHAIDRGNESPSIVEFSAERQTFRFVRGEVALGMFSSFKTEIMKRILYLKI